jgi:hypothetical protein
LVCKFSGWVTIAYNSQLCVWKWGKKFQYVPIIAINHREKHDEPSTFVVPSVQTALQGMRPEFLEISPMGGMGKL